MNDKEIEELKDKYKGTWNRVVDNLDNEKSISKRQASRILLAINFYFWLYRIKTKIKIEDLTFGLGNVSDLKSGDGKLSQTLIDHIWKPLDDTEVFHYTELSIANSISSSGKLRFYSLKKNYGFNEVETLCKKLGFTGYLSPSPSGEPKWKEMHERTFIFCCSPNTNSLTIHPFVKYGKDARLRLKISRHSTFKRMIYKKFFFDRTSIIKRLDLLLHLFFQRRLTLKGYSTIIAFYLPSKFKTEDEFRIALRFFDTHPNYPETEEFNVTLNDKIKYIEIPLYSSSASSCPVRIELLGVEKWNGSAWV